MLEQLRGLGWWPGGSPGSQTRHMPGGGRWPGGMPRVAAVLGLRPRAGDGWGDGSDAGIGLQAAAARIAMVAAAIVAKRMTPPGKKGRPRHLGHGACPRGPSRAM